MIKDLRVTISISLSWDTHLILSSSRPTSSLDLWSGPALSQRTSMWGRLSTCFWWSPRWGTRLKCGPQTNTRSSVYKGELREMSKCRKKINLDVANFQPNKSTTQIWVTHHQYGISGLVLWTCHVGQEGETVVASGNVGFFISQATSFEICFDQGQTLSVCQRRSTPS